ncbi:MAG TPA: response regulator [Anaerolineae bacterium]|nr:response regulator [Anaerolineae bacterium]HIQ06122.1 response regulator [Anaerolineae bacterium]
MAQSELFLTNRPIRVLLVDDNHSDRALAREALLRSSIHFTVDEVATRPALMKALRAGHYDLVVTDFDILQFDGLEVLSLVQTQMPDTPVVLLTGTGSEEIAVAALKQGAADYVLKQVNAIRRLPDTLLAVLRRAHLERENARARQVLEALNAAAAAMSAAATPQAIFEALGKALQQLGFSFSIWLRDQQRNWLRLAYTTINLNTMRLGNRAIDLRIDDWPPVNVAEVPAFARVLREHRAHLVTNAGDVMRLVLPPQLQSLADQVLADLGYLRQIHAPIDIGGESMGLMAVAHPGNELTEQDLPTVTAFARQIGAALERAQLFSQLQESEERYRRLAENAPDIIFRWSPARGLEYISRAVETVLGYQPAQLYADPELATRVLHLEEIASTVRGPCASWTHRLQLRHRGGHIVHLEERLTPIYGEQDQFVAMEGIARDITEQVKAEEALRQRSEELAVLYAKARQREKQLLRLQEVSTRWTTTHDSQRLMTNIVNTVGEVFDVLTCSVMLFDQETAQVRIAASYGLPEGTEERFRLSLNHPLIQRIVETQSPLIIEDVDQQEPNLRRILVHPGVRAFYAFPLVVQGKVIGTLNMSMDRVEAPDGETRALFALFANQAAAVIENARLVGTIRAGEQRLRALSAQIVAAQEEERRRIARELHDEAGQALTVLKIGLEMAARQIPKSDPAKIADQLSSAIALADSTLEEIRALSQDLRPALLDEVGLVATLRWYTNQYEQRLQTPITLEVQGCANRPPAAIEVAVYRLVQEALTNVARHARATHVHLSLQCDTEQVWVFVQDNGIGFDPKKLWDGDLSSSGIGLTGMRERVALLGGELQVQSSPGKGTTITAWFPLSDRTVALP